MIAIIHYNYYLHIAILVVIEIFYEVNINISFWRYRPALYICKKLTFINMIYVTGPGKTGHVGTFSVMRKTDLKY